MIISPFGQLDDDDDDNNLVWPLAWAVGALFRRCEKHQPLYVVKTTYPFVIEESGAVCKWPLQGCEISQNDDGKHVWPHRWARYWQWTHSASSAAISSLIQGQLLVIWMTKKGILFRFLLTDDALKVIICSAQVCLRGL